MAEVKLDSAAQTEYDHALDWYAARSLPAAAGFVAAVDAAIDRIRQFPDAHPWADAVHRFVRLKKYPFTLYYLPGDPVRVVAVAHDKQPPGYWHGRP